MASPRSTSGNDIPQAEYKRMLTKAEPEFGNMPIAALDDARVRKDFLAAIKARLKVVRAARKASS